MRPHPSTCANPTVAGLSICVASQPILNFWRAPLRTVWAGGGFETCPCRGPVSSLPQTGISIFGCRYPCEKERIPSTRRYFWAPVPMAVGCGARLLLWYMRCGVVKGGLSVVLGIGHTPLVVHSRSEKGRGAKGTGLVWV